MRAKCPSEREGVQALRIYPICDSPKQRAGREKQLSPALNAVKRQEYSLFMVNISGRNWAQISVRIYAVKCKDLVVFWWIPVDENGRLAGLQAERK